ncbi:MAG: RsmB/NOP family class I SAM-dependent RNA methyltransferase [Pseudooceanicola sp.]
MLMTPAARIAAAAEILDQIRDGTPATKALVIWGRSSRFAGSGDRRAIRDLVYDALRCRRSAACLGGGETGRALMLGLLRASGTNPDTVFTGSGHAPALLTADEALGGGRPETPGERTDLPDWLVPLFEDAFGTGWEQAANTLRERAPVFLRVNALKTTLEQAITDLSSSEISASAHSGAETALKVVQGARKIAQSAAYLNGLVELQDVSSQAAVASISIRNGMKVLDYCAGGGGKTLAMAARVDANYFCHDIAPARMADMPARAERAGATVTLLSTDQVGSLAPFDIVLCDAPCSGSGSWRRDPEGKWALTEERLEALCATQDEILDQAALLVGPKGVLAYATCSVLRAENEARIAAFIERNAGWIVTLEQRFGMDGEGDGFFVAHLTRCDMGS